MHLHHAVPFLDQVLVQARILDGNHRLASDDIEHAGAVGVEVMRVGMREQHHAVNVESAA